MNLFWSDFNFVIFALILNYMKKIYCILLFVSIIQLGGAQIYEIGVFGGGFAGVTFAHSFWAIRQIAKQEKGDPTT